MYFLYFAMSLLSWDNVRLRERDFRDDVAAPHPPDPWWRVLGGWYLASLVLVFGGGVALALSRLRACDGRRLDGDGGGWRPRGMLYWEGAPGHRDLPASAALARLRAYALQTAVNSRVIIEQAMGVLAVSGQLSIDAAFTALRGYARRTNRRLSDVARALADRDLLPAVVPAPAPAMSPK